jgi:hypothetical protein
MRESGVLVLDRGDEIRIEVDPNELEKQEFVVHRIPEPDTAGTADRLAVIDRHLATAKRHPAGTTDRLLEDDRERPY